jgi:MFS family permease
LTFFDLLKREPRALGFGLAHTFASGPGQTFLFSLFVPSLVAALPISHAGFASLYTAATLLSAACLPLLGRWIDRLDLVTYSIAAGVMLAVAALIMATATTWPVLFLAVFALRLSGQGLMSHIAMTATARYFDATRGRALALVSLGFPLGEAILPLLTISLIASLGWRPAYGLLGLTMGLIVVPLASLAILRLKSFRRVEAPAHGHTHGVAVLALMRSPYVWAILPLLATAPLLVTALIFHQGYIAAERGLSLGLFAAAFVAFAVVQAPSGLASGPIIDRFGAGWLLALHGLPAALGVAIFALFPQPWSVPVYLALLGATSASGNTARTAILAEMVPAHLLGTVRSYLTAVMVLSTAVGPTLFAAIIAGGLGVQAMLWTASVIFILTAGLGGAAQVWLLGSRPNPAELT